MGRTNYEIVETIVGKTVEEAEKLCGHEGFRTRITQEDGRNYIITMDLRFDRVNLEIENGIVKTARIG